MFDFFRKKKPHATFRTTHCREHGHPEVTIQLNAPLHIPDVEKGMLSYFENAVAGGTVFRPGERVKMGWSVVRICKRSDGTLGVEERELGRDEIWKESVDHALRDTWLQVQVAASVGVEDRVCFPDPDQLARVQPCMQRPANALFLRLPNDDLPEAFSGWTLRCEADHEHEEADFFPLRAIAQLNPELVQFLALPHGSGVLIRWKESPLAPGPGMARIDPVVFLDNQPVAPLPGSFLDMLAQH